MTNESKRYKVAVYGTLLAGERNERWGAGAFSREAATIKGVLYDTGLGYPAFAPNAETGREVQVEVLTVDAEGLARMDQLEGFPTYYRRETVTASLADGGETAALVYVLNRLPARAAEIPDGDWRPYRRARYGSR